MLPNNLDCWYLTPRGGTDLERGYGDVQPWRPPFHASPAARKGPISRKRVCSQDPLLRKFGNFSLHSFNFHPNFNSQAPKFGNFSSQASKFGHFQLTSPQILKFSTHKPPFSEANVSSQAPHFGNPGRTPLPEKKLSAPPSGFDPTLGKAVAQRICSVVYSDSPFLKSDQYNSKNQNNMSTHLTIRNENHPNPRIATPKKKGLQWRDYFKNHKTNVFPITIWNIAWHHLQV